MAAYRDGAVKEEDAMIENDAEIERARAFVRELAENVAPKAALLIVLRCDPNQGHGVWVDDVRCIVDIYNVSPVILRVDRVDMKLGVWWSGKQILTARDAFSKRVELLPGRKTDVPFAVSARRIDSGALVLGQALHAEAKISVDIEGPAAALCCRVESTWACWMPCREGTP